jgi:hypothetical protein
VRTGGLGAAVTFTATAAATSYTDNTAVGSTSYSYVVTAINGDKQTASAPATVTTPLAILAAPTGLTGTLTSATSATLSWTDTTTVETGFAIWRSTNGAAAVQIATTTPVRTTAQRTGTGGTVTYVNTGLTSGATYTYYVKAISGATAATASNVITVKVASPDAPAALANTSVTRVLVVDSVALNWTQSGTAPVTSSTVQWATNAAFTTGVGQQNINSSATSGTVLVGRGLANTPNPLALYFRVRSTNGVGNSVYSAAIGPIALK